MVIGRRKLCLRMLAVFSMNALPVTQFLNQKKATAVCIVRMVQFRAHQFNKEKTVANTIFDTIYFLIEICEGQQVNNNHE